MASEQVKVVTFWASPYGLRAEFALTAKGVPYQRLLEVDHWHNKSKILVESNPIPVLLHNGKPLPESLLIIEYVDEVWPSPDGKHLLPPDPYDRAMARFWFDFAEKKLNKALKSILFKKGDVQNAAVEEALRCISTLEGVLEKASSSKDAPFFGGDHIGMVDCVLGPFSLWFPAYEIIGDFKFELQEKYPHMHTWYQALRTSSVAACIPDSDKLLEFILGLRKVLCRE
ncbi:hypothetical protein GOP47_0007084 [Adiantum capillus-veneris]|uniref:glutathione transferase n=1 Tax=Adiantum capillus-veneris TaxID=13818 RepID=A0A9D4ZLJ8_ADICA|nr:hypothetical protein GOP47_0007084 [Adiantum capillus-veneris]